VHTFHPAELDVAGGAGPADPGLRAGRVQDSHAVRHRRHDLPRLDDYEVVVGDERKRPASLPGTVVEHDRAGGGDRDRAGGKDGVDAV
jgi:hypothetical protein